MPRLTRRPRPRLPAMLGAVDLGSNSFHLVVAQPRSGTLKVVDKLREPIRLAAGLRPDGTLTEDAQRRALACLRRFGQRLRQLPAHAVRVVATQTLRAAHHASAFLNAAEEALGHPVEVIAGREEARLIYLGVAHSLADSEGKRLVVDIGGASTELIVGERFQPLHMESLQTGSVSLTTRCFPDGKLTRKRWIAAEIAARLELEPVAAAYRRLRWQVAVGSSGSVRALSRVAGAAGWSDGTITPEVLAKSRRAVLKAGHLQNLTLPGLSGDRVPIFPAGVVILSAVFTALGLNRLDVASGALRDGLLYDLLGRFQDDDVRRHSVARLAARFQADPLQAKRVQHTALHSLAAVAPAWALTDARWERLVGWAAQLHEIGLDLAHSQYHKHGAYLAEHADLPGFSRQEQRLLALLIRAQRRKFPVSLYLELPPRWAEGLTRLAILLRLAVLLHRARSDLPLPRYRLRADRHILRLRFPQGWLQRHPLTRADLEQEAVYLSAAGFILDFAGLTQ